MRPRRRAPGRPRRLLWALATLGLIPLASARPVAPLQSSEPLSAGQRLRRAPLERRLPGPGQVLVGRFLSLLHTARGPRARGAVGDYFLRSPGLLLVVRASDGMLLDLAPGPDFRDGVGWGRQQICQGKQRHDLRVASFSLQTGSRPALEVRSTVAALGLEVRSRYLLPGAAQLLELETEVRNQRATPLADVGLCEVLGLGNTRVQVPGVGEVRRSQEVRALFAARAEAGVSYLLMRPDGAQLPLRLEMPPPQGAFDPTLAVDYERSNLVPGGQLRVRRFLVVRPGPMHLALAAALTESGLPLRRWRLELEADPRHEGAPPARLLLRRDGKPFLLTAAERQMSLSLPEEGSYSAALLLPGVGEGPAQPLTQGRPARLRLPATARLLISSLDESGRPRPARLLIRGRPPTPDPAFGEEGLRLENVVYLRGGEEPILLRPGRHQLIAGRGPFHELARTELSLAAGQTRKLTLTPRQVVRTPGWLSADLHLHSAASFDSPLDPLDRVIAGAAQSVEMMVLTDHNVITPWPAAAAPASQPALPLPLLISGQEVTTEGTLVGHFNVFPLGAPELVARQVTPAQIFAAARDRRPVPLIQVNHPRMGSIGYFEQVGLRSDSGKAGPLYRSDFDLLELINGDDVGDLTAIERVLQDWYRLLGQGHRPVATAGSDGHRLPFQETGTPRTLILWDPSGKASAPSEQAALQALRAGRTVATTGPFLRFSLDGQPPGSLLRGGKRPLPLLIEVQAPAHLDPGSASLIANGVALFTQKLRPGSGVRLELRRNLQPAVDTWYTVVVRGERPDPSQLVPVLPFAVSNPIFVDVDGDGRCLPPAATPPP